MNNIRNCEFMKAKTQFTEKANFVDIYINKFILIKLLNNKINYTLLTIQMIIATNASYLNFY